MKQLYTWYSGLSLPLAWPFQSYSICAIEMLYAIAF